MSINVQSLSKQMGASPVHMPLALHSLVRSPLRVNPLLQLYLTIEPTLLLLIVTIPLSGFGKSWNRSR